MATRDTYNYTYRMGHKFSRRGIITNPARRERELQLARAGGKLTVDGRPKTRPVAQKV